MWREELLMQNAPIVFIHMGNQRYLRKVIKQAELYNRDVFWWETKAIKLLQENGLVPTN